MDQLFEEFLKEKRFIQNASLRTVQTYRESWETFKKFEGEVSAEGFKRFVRRMREAGLTVGGCNVRARSLNSFLTWLYANHHTEERLRCPVIPSEPADFEVFTESQIKTIIKYRPRDYYEWRLWTMMMLLIDTGMRVSEMLPLKVPEMDLDLLRVRVLGKRGKRRTVPLSTTMRKHLWSWLKRRRGKGELVFPTEGGTVVSQRNFLRGMKTLCGRLGITGVRASPHTFRHYYAINFLRQGGDLHTLMTILGHKKVGITAMYLRMMPPEYTQEKHQHYSPLEN